MAAAMEDCPCCDADLADMDGSMIQAFLSGYLAGRKNLTVTTVLCARHVILSTEALQFVAAQLKGIGR